MIGASVIDMSEWDDIREVLDTVLVPYMTRNEELNRERLRNKEHAIKWMLEQLKNGPVKGGVRGNSEMSEIPEYLYMFGSSVWEADRRAVILRDPVCRICGKRKSEEVHHIRPKHLKGSYYHPCNLIGLCKECHDEVHRNIDAGIDSVIESSLDCGIDDAQKTLEEWN